MRVLINPHRCGLQKIHCGDIRQTLAQLRDFFQKQPDYSPTPIFSLPGLADDLGVSRILVKDESGRFGLPAFKVTGALYAIGQLQKIKGYGKHFVISAASTGNHGTAVAWAAKRHGLKAVVYLPKSIGSSRAKQILAEGAEVRLVPGHYDQAVDRMVRDSLERGHEIVSDVSCEFNQNVTQWIMDGYLSLFDESMDQISQHGEKPPTHLFLQAGVGAFASSGVRYFSGLKSSSRIVVVEPTEADCLYQSALTEREDLRGSQGKLVTMMNGLNCRYPSALAWPFLKSGVTAFMTINDSWIGLTRKILARQNPDESFNSGPSGIAGLAGLVALSSSQERNWWFQKLQISKESIVLVVNTEAKN